VVWQGVHRQSGEIFAVKVVQRNGLKPSDDAAVLNEVAIMQQLSGKKYFCQLMDFYEEKEAFYLVMEFMAGGT
jgi:calcium/calmodulin-dependent protein kinase I